MYRSVLRAIRRHFLVATLALLLCSFLALKYGGQSSLSARDNRLKLTIQFEQADNDRDSKTQEGPILDSNPMTVHLVVASTASEDISWTSKLKIPGLQVIHYVADDPSAPHHPPANKGREAMIYHSYFYDFYDNLPDVAIMVHAHDISWHMEPLLSHSVSYAVSHLDLLAVKERGYANLRVSWDNACPAYIDTTLKGTTGLALEGQSTREAFLQNFGAKVGLMYDAPEILAQPCCNQFAVTGDTIRTVSKEQYRHFINWFLTSPMDDFMLGRTWEHMFQWLFTTRAVDCPMEWKTYCKMYRICFESREEYRNYMRLEMLQEDLIDQYDLSFFKALWTWRLGNGKQELARAIGVVSRQINEVKGQALERGRAKQATSMSTDSLYY